MNPEELLQVLSCFHLQTFSSGRELIQALQEDDYVRQFIAPVGGIKRSTFFDRVNERGVEQLLFIFTELQKQAASVLPTQHADLGDLAAIDGSLVDVVLPMHWAEYRTIFCLLNQFGFVGGRDYVVLNPLRIIFADSMPTI